MWCVFCFMILVDSEDLGKEYSGKVSQNNDWKCKIFKAIFKI